jgi:ATP-binding cassette, subfamily C, bacterial CydD
MAETDAGDPPRVRSRPIDPRLLSYSTASRGFLLASAVIVLGQTAVIVAFAWLLTHVLVGAIGGAPVAQLWPYLGAAALVVVVRAALIAVSEHVSARGAAKASLQLRSALVAAVGRLGPSWLSQRNAASLAVTAGHGLEALDAYFGRYLPQLVATAIATPLLVVAMLVADPVSGITVIVTLPLIPIFMVLIGLATRAVQRRQYATLGRLAARFADTVGGLGTLKIFGRQHRAADSIESVTRDYKRETMTVLRVSFLSGFALEFLASISVALIAVTIGFRLLAGEMPLEIGLFVLLLAPEAYLPLRQVGVQFHAAAEGVAATDGIFEVLDAARSDASDTRVRPPHDTVEESSDATGPLLEARGLVVQRGAWTIGPVDLAVAAGEVVLLEGPSGAGKSSVLAALLGFAPHDGVILVSGAPNADARALLAWAGQRPGLMAGSVRDNVALGDRVPDDDRVRAALASAQAHDVDPRLDLGAQGAGLSGGQAQRVAVARALYRLRSGRARILALDEPTSALDAETEAAVWGALRAEADAGAGILLVSHRATARGIADRVVRLELPSLRDPEEVRP